MGYEFRCDIPAEEYEGYLRIAPAAPFSQRIAWSRVKDYWENTHCGLYRDGVLCGAAQILIRKLPMGMKIAYSPRGFLIDLTDREAVAAFTAGIREWAKKKKVFCVKLDPFIRRDDPSAEQVFETLKGAGYLHKGFGLTLYDYFMPRFQMAVALKNEDGTMRDKKELLKSFKKGARSYIGNYHKNRGVFFEKAAPDDDLTEFARLMHCTESRQNVVLRNLEYFHKLKNGFGDDCVIYYSKIDLDVFIEYTRACIEKEQNVETNTRNLEQALAAREERGKIVTLSTGLMLMPAPADGMRMVEYLYGGSDLSLLPNLSTPNGLLYQAMCDSIDDGCDYFNLGGVEGTLDTPLYEFKQKFSPELFELVGEFDLVIRKVKYKLFDSYLPSAKHMITKVRRRMRNH